MQKIKQYFQSLLLWELIKGLRLTGKYLFKRKITVQYPEEKTPQSPRSAVYMRYAGTQMAKKDVLPVSYVKQSVQQLLLPSSPNNVMMELVARPAMISI